MPLPRLVTAQINLSNYAHNIAEIKKLLAPHIKIMSVIKANAYGHGAIGIAKHAQQLGVDYLGVICLYEAKELRTAGITMPILILNYIDPDAALEAVNLDVSVTVIDADVVAALSEYAQKTGKKPKIHVKVDTGMHRSGVVMEKAVELIEKVADDGHLELEGIFTHFATADDTDLSFARQQLDTFTKLIESLKEKDINPPLIHAANSAATIQLPESHFTMVRPGVLTYGLHPYGLNDPVAFKVPFEPKPVMRLTTQVISHKTIQAGESVGYGRGFIADRKTKVALIPIGYADGFRRAPQNFGEILVKGQRAPLLGRVSMDQSSIDVTNIPDVKVGDEVVIIGSQGSETISAEDVAAKLGTINYEVMCGLAARVTRVYVDAAENNFAGSIEVSPNVRDIHPDTAIRIAKERRFNQDQI
jgi:alanine racemase